MRNVQMLAVLSLLFIPSGGFAENAPTKVEPGGTARRAPPQPPADSRPFGIIRQDLFDRNNPTNLRSNYSAPPAQPGQF